MLLQTDRLTVRPVEASDWKAMQAIWLDFSKSPYVCFDVRTVRRKQTSGLGLNAGPRQSKPALTICSFPYAWKLR